MDDYLPAIGRDVGKIDTDAGGLARFSFKLQVPPGINYNTVPELSLEYSQGAGNGSLGVGWALGGISCIRIAPSNLAYDGVNSPPKGYRLQPKYTLDGAELLNVVGEYGAQNAQYTTEVDNIGKTVTTLGTGFLVLENTGRQLEYGTTADSCVGDSTIQTIREWRLKRIIDYHGNAIIYTYTTSPQTGGTIPDSNACYISSIRYTSNIKTGHQGARIIKFEYTSRPDPVVQIAQGTRCVWASRLMAIRFGVIRGENTKFARSYELAYNISAATGDSCLVSITETSSDGSNKISLLPSTFGYTTSGVSREDMFKTVPQTVSSLRSTVNNVALFAMNISGRCLADLACIRYDRQRMTIKTYLAKNSGGVISWDPSQGPGAEADLPQFDVKNGFPSILCPDMSNDGRADFVVPYPDSDKRVRFSISQSVGTGFLPARIEKTDFLWVDGSKFMAMDVPGQGPSIIQIFSDANKLTLRSFPSVVRNGVLGLGAAVTTRTKYGNIETIDWVQLSHAGTGAKSLVRIWTQDVDGGRKQIKATTFKMSNADDTNGTFQEGQTSLLGPPVRANQYKCSVLSCDVTADGTQDIVLATTEYSSPNMKLTLDSYLGDGLGGFTKNGSTVTKQLPAPEPLKATNYGQFHVTNVNGSNYPSLSYVYQQRSKAFLCLSVDGRSDGLFTDPVMYELARNPISEKMDVIATDINGNGMGDWLFYTLDNDSPRVLPIYNRSNVVDFLSWTRNSMGLRTDLSYGSLADPAVYKSSVEWERYNNDSKEFYPVIAAPNYVVTGLEHRNDSTINSLEYRVSIKKTYGKARISSLGRGWQGFEEIHTLNATDNVLTTERYLQSWPLTCSKCQVDTKTPNGQLLKTIKSSFQQSFAQKGQWKIYRTDRTSEQTDMIEAGTVIRSNTTKYEFDANGNMILQSLSETQHGQLMYQSWKRCSYTTIDGVTGVLTSQKFSANEANVNMTKFEPGDAALAIYENEPTRAVLKSMSTWSSDVGEFVRKQFTFDEFGRQIRSIDATGLQRTTTFDDLFQSFPVKTVEQGPGVSSTELTAFDDASGMEIARLETSGLLTCYCVDDFGRIVETRAKAAERTGLTVEAGKFCGRSGYVAHIDLQNLLMASHLDPHRTISFTRERDSRGSVYMSTKVVTFTKEGVSGQHEVAQYVDCVKQNRKQSYQNADDPEKIWTYWEYDSRGEILFESFPTKAPTSVGVEWMPDRKLGVKSTVDTLGRTTMRVRPAHGQQERYIISATTYLDGGAKIQEQTMSSSDPNASSSNAKQLALLQRRYIRVGKEDLVIENVDENDLRSSFQYNIYGKLTQSTDPSGQKELRSYNSRGDLATVDNVYQNMARKMDQPATRYKFNAAGHIVAEENAANEIITYQRDAKGRPLLKVGRDGRTVKCVYDISGYTNLSSVTIYPRGSDNSFESKFEFEYDHRGRVKQRKLTLNDGTSFTTSVTYDWQDQEVKRVFQDRVVATNEYRGSEMVSRTLSGGSNAWSVKADTLQYSAHGAAEKLRIQGTGMKLPFLHDWEYDAQGFPVTHSLSMDNKTLVKEHYLYNDMDQIGRKHEFLTGKTAEYVYKGKRLVSSQSGSEPLNSYNYDSTGNLTNRRGTTLAYSQGRVTGTKDGRDVVDVRYDDAGRMTTRTTDGSVLTFLYDSFGDVKGWKDATKGESVDLSADYDGQMLQRKNSDGSSSLFVSDDLSIHIQPNGTRVVRYHMTNASNADNTGHNIITVSDVYESAQSKNPLAGRRSVDIEFSDTKGNVTRIYNGENAELCKKLEYDDYGLLDTNTVESLNDRADKTYEGNFVDSISGLLNFGARWYDPLIGRFTTPDDFLLEMASLIRTDGLNRYVFENNDPINNIDPTGHWSLNAVLGVVVSTILIAAAVAVTIATGGAAAPLAAAVVGALASGGVAGIIYSVKHQDETDSDKFWGGWGTTVALNAAIGAATGALGAVASPARMASAAGRLAARAVIGGTASLLGKAAERGVDNLFYGTHHDLFEGAAKSFVTGAVVGVGVGYLSDKFSSAGKAAAKAGIDKASAGLKGGAAAGAKEALTPKTGNSWLSSLKNVAKVGGKGLLKPGSKLAIRGAQEIELHKTLLNSFFEKNLV